jgi:hypothetical protein
MGTAPTTVLLTVAGTGNSADGKITRDAVDDLIGAMQSHLLIYMRAVRMNPIAASFKDALGNIVTCQYPSDCTFNASDSNFNNHSSVTFNQTSGANLYNMAAGGIGIGTPPVAMTNSFTFMAGIRPSASFLGALYGDTAGTNGSANTSGFYLTTAGALVGVIGGTSLTFSGSQPLLAPATTGVIWMSYDAGTNIVRAGVNSTAVQLTATSAVARNGAGTSTICYPFGYESAGAAGDQSFNRWTLWNKAFMNGSVPADDAAFTNLVSTYAAYL